MYFKFGNFQHADNEVDVTSFTIQRMFSPRNTLMFQRHTIVLQGHLIASTQATIKTAIEELEAAYRLRAGGVNGGLEGKTLNAGLYHDDGTQSAHFLDASSSINGVRVLALSYQKDDGGEYATGRHYSVVLQADYINVENQIYSYQETLQFIGDCGRRWELVPTYSGDMYIEVIYERTPQTIIQAGSSVGVSAWPLPNAPLMNAVWIHGDQSYVEYTSPEMSGDNDSLLYLVRWRYVASHPTSMVGKIWPRLKPT